MQKNYFKFSTVLLIIILFIGISIFPAYQSHVVNQEQYQGDNIDDWIPILKQMGPFGTYNDYLKSREVKPFSLQKIYESPDRSTNPLVIIFIDNELVSPLSDELSIYYDDLDMVGYETVIYHVSGVEPEDLKDQLISHWEGGQNVVGAVLIGDLPTEWYHHENDFYGSSEFPCDLFLMDLDGQWTDTDSNGMYDSHTDGSGDTAPEIYIGRIDASNIPGEEIPILKKYFEKVHDFWSGATTRTEYGLSYTDHDWADIESFRHDISYAYENYEAIWYPDVNRNDYMNNRIPDEYEFIQLSCHSSSQGHVFEDGGWAYNDEVRDAPPEALFYNLFCCSSLRFTDYNCLGYAYILDTNTPSLSVVGSAKTGSMLDFQYFYWPIGNGSSLGTALKEWFEYEYPYDDDPGGYNDVSWFYGMTILGDPTLIIRNRPPYGENFIGPDIGYEGQELEFSLDVFDQDGDEIYCLFDWSDSTSNEWLGTYNSGETIYIIHVWDDPGEYSIFYKLKDSFGLETSWSNPSQITIMKNDPPDKPTISGPSTGTPKKSMSFTFSSIDPEQHDIYFYISWGDGNIESWEGPYSSGEEVTFKHAWNKDGDYKIIAKTMDQYGQKSQQNQFILKINRNRAVINQGIIEILEIFMNRLPKIFPTLHLLQGLFR